MLKKVWGAGVRGTEGFLVCCEADVENGFPQFTFIGSLTGTVRESGDRVRTAISNTGIYLDPKHVIINLSPADIRKEGNGYDLPVAAALLASYGVIPGTLLEDSLFAGELSLGGEILPVNGVLSMVAAAKEAGLKRCFLPMENLREGAVIRGISCHGARNLGELTDFLTGARPLPPPADWQESPEDLEYPLDFADICGQELVRRATLLAVGGRHNILYIGPAGTGKSMIAERIPTIMPAMTMEERLEISRIYSISGLLSAEEPLMRRRPFRHPHHTITPQALTGGGVVPKPGEISLADHGVLFLDELPEFRSMTLEILRQPMEDKTVRISRLHGAYVFPANFQLVCAMNPCRCGFWPDRTRCSCTDAQVRAYIGRISRPLLDRIDLCAETAAVDYESLSRRNTERISPKLREEVERVREIQAERFRDSGIRFNSEMRGSDVETFCALTKEDDRFLSELYKRNSMSARGLHRILKVARTAADFAGSEEIRHEDLCEAIAFRSLEDKYWGGGR